MGELRAPHSAPGRHDLPAARAPEGRRGRAGRGGRGRRSLLPPARPRPERPAPPPERARAGPGTRGGGGGPCHFPRGPPPPRPQLPAGHPVAESSSLPGRPSSDPILLAAEVCVGLWGRLAGPARGHCWAAAFCFSGEVACRRWSSRAGSCTLRGPERRVVPSRCEVARATWAGWAPCPPLGGPGLDRAGPRERSGGSSAPASSGSRVPGLRERVAEGGTV